MLNLFCKTLVPVRFTCTKNPQSSTLYAIYQNPTSHLSRILKSINLYSTSAEKYSFTVSFLVNTCGFSLQSAKSISKHVAFDNPEKPHSVLAFLRSNDFSETQISTVVKRCPSLLLSCPEKTLVPKYDFLITKGFSKSDLANLLSKNPHILKRSLKGHIIPIFDFLKSILGSYEKTCYTVTCFSHVLNVWNAVHYLAPNIKTLQDCGVTRLRIARLLRRQPRVVTFKPERFREVVMTVKEMGVDPSKAAFINGVATMAGVSQSNWEKRVQLFKLWGWSDEEVTAAFAKHPYCLARSDDKIMQVMDYLVNKLGWEASWLVKAPVIFGLSLDGRIIPRALVLQFLTSKQLVKRDSRLVGFIPCPEKVFLRRFVECHEEIAPQLLEIYKAKLHHSRKPNDDLAV